MSIEKTLGMLIVQSIWVTILYNWGSQRLLSLKRDKLRVMLGLVILLAIGCVYAPLPALILGMIGWILSLILLSVIIYIYTIYHNPDSCLFTHNDQFQAPKGNDALNTGDN